VHAHDPYGAPASQFPVATRASAQGLWLPSAFSLKQSDVGRTCDVIRQALAS
jgi:dTDP-4-amino-4,6-dideoxygalactose transaminase